MAIKQFFKYWKWKLMAMDDKCPFCSLKLVPHHDYNSFSDDFTYTCPYENCEFNRGN